MREYNSITAEVFDALAGRDNIYLGSGNDKVFGNAGDDIIFAGAGDDLISGGGDNDKIDGGAGNDTLYGGDGNDRVHGQAGDDEIHGGAGNDKLNGHVGNDVITGGGGADRINGGDNDDFLFGDAGNDSIVAGNGNDTVDGGADDDLIYGNAGNDVLNGGTGDDFIIGGTGFDTIHGDAGNDVLLGLGDDDTMFGGTGRDTLYGGAGNDSLNGDAGNDDLFGGDGDDIIDGGTEEDIILGGDNNDTITGGNGHDIIFGDRGDTAQGWIFKYYDLASSPTTLAAAGFTLNDGVDNTNAATSVGVSQILNPNNYDTGDNYAIKYETYLTITTAGSYTFRTSSDDGSQLFLDNVQIVDNDGLHGVVTITSAAQTLAAGVYKLDATFFERTGGNVMDVLMAGPDTGGSYITLANYAGVNATDGANTVSSGVDFIDAGAGDDTVYGDAGDDTITGGTGNDILSGGAGNDILNGGDGNDEIYGIDSADSATSSAASGTLNSQNANFNTTLDGYAYVDDYLGISTGGGAFSNGVRDTTDGGLANGSLRIDLGGINNTNVDNMSGAFEEVYNKASATSSIYLQFTYRILLDSGTEVGEDGSAFYNLNGTTTTINTLLGATGGGANDDTGWISTTIDLGVLATGNHTLALGGLLTAKTQSAETANIWFDDVTWVEQEISTNTGIENTISGGDGLDTLYGSSETDIFVFENITAFADDDVIVNFNVLEDDQIDISDLLTGFIVGTSNISEFLEFTDSGSDTLIQVDTDGAVGGTAFVTIGEIAGLTGLDEVALYNNGSIIV